MLLFRLILVVLNFLPWIFAQNESVSVEFNNDLKSFEISSEKVLRNEIFSIQSQYGTGGFLNTYLVCTDMERLADKSGKIRTYWEIVGNSPLTIDSLVIDGISEINLATLNKFFYPILHQRASDRSLEKTENIIDFYQYFKKAAPPYYATFDDKKIALILPVEADFKNSFSGAFGYAPDLNSEPQLTGEIQVHLENMFETASVTDLWWQRKDELSQILSISYEEPFIWHFNVGAGFSFFQNLQDGLYVRRRTGITGVKPFSPYGKWYIGGEKISVTVTPDGDSLGLFDHKINSLIVENVWETRNSVWNPTEGFFVNWSLEVGDYSGSFISESILSRGKIEFETVKPIRKMLNFTLHGSGGFVALSGNRSVPRSEKFLIGGASTLRGYREQVFQFDWMFITQLELRFILNRNNRIYLFNDMAIQEEIFPIPISIGLGIQQKTPLGILRLDYALSRDDTPSEGKVHIRLIGEF